MENPIYIGLSRQAQLRREIGVVANNIANMDTTAFKRQINVNQAYDQRIRYGEKLAFVIDIGTAMDLQEGGFKVTGNSMDVALRGQGYFQIDDGASVKYTRNGSFALDDQNRLVTQQGNLVLDDNARPIVVPGGGSSLNIAGDGLITYDEIEIGRLGVVEFQNPQDLKASRDSLFISEEDPQPAEDTRVLQGSLETSNVNPIVEMTEMIEIHRTYDSVKRLMDQENERQKQVTQRLARPLQNA
ncbi:MAG: flagellar basal-body rod protein FlgF [Alphaproteobacteria bacterium]|nr:flagellar basal-body rod protein FlgF [Alphaproteobacteria bacterium]